MDAIFTSCKPNFLAFDNNWKASLFTALACFGAILFNGLGYA